MKMTEKSSIETQPSETAMGTAFLRALAVYDPRKEIRGNDTLAEIFLDEKHKQPLKDQASRAWVLKNRVLPGAYELMIARTAFFDRIVERALKENIEQVVLLGAGYDSRPYRFKTLIQDTKIFELDASPTQQRKKERLQSAKISISEQIIFVPINFEKNNLRDALMESGFSREKETLFIWEGVTYYLNQEAIDNMLGFLKSNSPPGSSIGFDYASLSDEALNEDGAKELRVHMQSRYPNEPIKFGIQAVKIKTFLAERGLEVVEHLTASEMSEKYLSIGNYPDVARVPSLFCLVYAKVIIKGDVGSKTT